MAYVTMDRAFDIYIALGPERSLEQLFDKLKADMGAACPLKGVINAWYRGGNWQKRAAEMDAAMDARHREERNKLIAQVEAGPLIPEAGHMLEPIVEQLGAAHARHIEGLSEVSADILEIVQTMLKGGGKLERGDGKVINVPPIKLNGSVKELRALTSILVQLGGHFRLLTGGPNADQAPDVLPGLHDDQLGDAYARMVERVERRRRLRDRHATVIDITPVAGGRAPPGGQNRNGSHPDGSNVTPARTKPSAAE